jgi:hypothetical protein
MCRQIFPGGHYGDSRHKIQILFNQPLMRVGTLFASISFAMEQAWNDAQDKLKASLQKEIHIMREILANMHQEELSLMLHDKISWNKVMEERAQMVQRLGGLRTARMQATQILQSLTSNTKNKELSLEQLLSQDEVSCCEIRSLCDQLSALTERMNKQNSRNQNLYHQVQYRLGPPPAPHPQRVPQAAKRKISVTTLKPWL